MPAPYQLSEIVSTRLLSSGLSIPILYAVDLQSIVLNSQFAPCVNIIPFGIQVLDQSSTISLSESVYVAVCTKYANSLNGQGTRQLASNYLIEIANSLLNYKVTGYSKLKINSPPSPLFIDGFGYYPLVVSSSYEIN